MLKILKFGGTSLGNAERMRQIAEIVRQNYSALVVLSAMSGVTNCLVKIAELCKENKTSCALNEIDALKLRFATVSFELFSDNELLAATNDELNSFFSLIITKIKNFEIPENEKWLLAQGEIITSSLFYRFIASETENVSLINALEFMLTDADNEPVLEEISKNLNSILTNNDSRYLITQGYICRNHKGEVDNLNRGGSDYTATLIGAAIRSEGIEIWTDIDGLHNNDPRLVEGTSPIRVLSFDEAAELAYFGAKILHPSCVWPAQKMNIPITLKNTLNPASQGTIISSSGIDDTLAIAAKGGITIVKVRSGRMMNAYGFLKRVFEVFENYRIPIDVITTSEISVALTIDNDTFLDSVLSELNEFGLATSENHHAIVCVVGDSLEYNFAKVTRIVQSLEQISVKMISFGGGKNNITLVVHENYLQKALNHLHEALFNSQTNTVFPCFSPKS